MQNQYWQSISTDTGRMIVLKSLAWNGNSLIGYCSEDGSNVTDTNHKQLLEKPVSSVLNNRILRSRWWLWLIFDTVFWDENRRALVQSQERTFSFRHFHPPIHRDISHISIHRKRHRYYRPSRSQIDVDAQYLSQYVGSRWMSRINPFPPVNNMLQIVRKPQWLLQCFE
jgi:hypothetical protein